MQTVQQEPFPFFDLPEEIVYRILKLYVPVTDKKGSLSRVDAFQPYLKSKGVWFSSTLRLYELSNVLASGWYVNPDDLHYRYHVSIDYDELTFTVSTFFTGSTSSSICVNTNHVLATFDDTKATLTTIRQHLNPIEEHDVLYYEFSAQHCSQTISLWIFTRDKTVCWSGDTTMYPLINNRSIMVCWNLCLLLTFYKDSSVKLNLQTRQGPEEEMVIFPRSFKTCHETEPTIQQRSNVSKCSACDDFVEGIHAKTKTVLTNVDLEASVVIKDYFFHEKDPDMHTNLRRGHDFLEKCLKFNRKD